MKDSEDKEVGWNRCHTRSMGTSGSMDILGGSGLDGSNVGRDGGVLRQCRAEYLFGDEVLSGCATGLVHVAQGAPDFVWGFEVVYMQFHIVLTVEDKLVEHGDTAVVPRSICRICNLVTLSAFRVGYHQRGGMDISTLNVGPVLVIA